MRVRRGLSAARAERIGSPTLSGRIDATPGYIVSRNATCANRLQYRYASALDRAEATTRRLGARDALRAAGCESLAALQPIGTALRAIWCGPATVTEERREHTGDDFRSIRGATANVFGIDDTTVHKASAQYIDLLSTSRL